MSQKLGKAKEAVLERVAKRGKGKVKDRNGEYVDVRHSGLT